MSDFNPRPPRGGRLGDKILALTGDIISIHAPREGGDGGYVGIGASDKAFQSTPPARGATPHLTQGPPTIRIISIHAPREGGDLVY